MRQIAFLAVFVAALTLAPPAAAAADWAWPVRGEVLTPYRNGDDPYAGGQHRGVDIAAPVGAPVDAATAGRVTFAGVAGSSGLTVSVRTADGRYDVSYLHLSAVAVHDGDVVDGGDRIGAVGVSGRRSAEQPHLHLGVRDAGSEHSYRDPLDFLPPQAPPVAEPQRPAPVPATAPVAAPPASAPATAPVVASPAHAVAGPAAQTAPLTVPAGNAGRASAAAPASSPAPAAKPSTASLRARSVTASADPGASAAARGADAAPAHRENGSSARPASGAETAVRPASLGAGPVRSADSPGGPRQSLQTHSSRAGSKGGIDVGWLAALIGLVLAATCLARPGGPRQSVRTGRSAAAVLLRPLTGRG